MRIWIVALLLAVGGQVQADVLRLGFGSNKPPYVFEYESRGLEYDLVMAAARQADFQVEVHYAPMERLHLMLQRGELDAIATVNAQSGEAFFYSDTCIEYYNMAIALSKRHLSLNSVADLGAYSISSFQRARVLLGREFQRMAEHNPHYHEEAQQIARNRLLYSGRVDVVVADQRIFRYFNSQVADQVDVSQPVTYYALFPPTLYSVGFRQAPQRDLFNQGLKAIRASGEYLRIEQRYAQQ